MRLFQFVKWWWKRNDEFNRTLACLGIWSIPCIIAVIWVGEKALLGIVFGIIVALLGWALYGIFCVLRGLWSTFNDEYPTEDIAIVRKLKGIPTPSKQEVYYD